ncbi:MAG: CocE/NonD family hydrolase [Oscillochloris sp.]|nr:CocE/NonD family hydrolase [Oscillochloris sp.]
MARRAIIAMAGVTLAGLSLIIARRALIGRALGLRPARYRIRTQVAVPVPMPDGVTLRADVFSPVGEERFPTILIRTPYGRASELGPLGGFGSLHTLSKLSAQLFAERGYHVVVQGVRGRYQSGGEFDPFINEAADGRATMEWIADQPWFNGSLGMWGPSYLGYCQLAVAADPPPYLRAVVPLTTSMRLSHLIYPEGTFALESILRWTRLIRASAGRDGQIDMDAFWSLSPLRSEPALRAGLDHLPLAEADQVAIGEPIPFFQRWLADSDSDSDYWRTIDLQRHAGRMRVPIHMVAGWHDIFLDGQLADYHALLAAGYQPYLTVLPHHHMDRKVLWEGVRHGLAWFDAHLRDEPAHLRRRPVRLALMGSSEWHEMDFWPPIATTMRYYLAQGGHLATDTPASVGGASVYTYDPANPTPSLGGPVLSTGAGSRDQATVEARSDVLTFTTAPLTAQVDVIGPVSAEIYLHSSQPITDIVARLCVVDRNGRSHNVCDGLCRVRSGRGEPQPDGSLRVTVAMWATAQRFRPGQRIRLQLCSAAHPRLSRSFGNDAPFRHGQSGPLAQQTIYHDVQHPSALVLPVMKYECCMLNRE